MTIKDIITRASIIIGETPDSITSPSRRQALSITRHAIAAIAYNRGYKYREITIALGRKNAATVCNCRKRSFEMLTYNKHYRNLYNAINSSAVQPPEN